MSCPLCKREDVLLTEHHLIPRTTINKMAKKLKVRPSDLRKRTVYICDDCHKQIHHLISEKDLANRFYTVDLLLSHADVAKFVSWVSNKKSISHKKMKKK